MDAQPNTPQGASTGAGGSTIVGKARETAAQLGDQVQQRGGEVLDAAHATTGNAQAALADALETGAEAIRARLRVGTADDGTADRAGAAQGGAQSRLAGAGEAAAGTLERSAMWLREHDLADLGGLLRQELRERPGRTALIALGLGFLLGRASRR